MKTKKSLILGLSLLAGASAFGQVPKTRTETTFNTVRVFQAFRGGAQNPSIDLYGQGTGSSNDFASFGVAQFEVSKATFGLGSADTVTNLASLDVTLTYNGRSFTNGDEFELLVTTDDLGDFSSISFNAAVSDVTGIDPAQFTVDPLSLGMFTYANNDGDAETFTATISAPVETELLAAINAGSQLNIIVVAVDTNHAITFSGLDNGFDPGDPMIDLSIEADADTGAPIISTIPANGAAQVLTDADIVLNFGESISAGTGTIDLLEVGGGLIESIDVAGSNVVFEGSTVTITPVSVLPGETEIAVEIAAGVIVDALGNSGLSDASFLSFTTGVSNTQPVFTATGPFAVSDQSLAGTVVGDVDVNDDGVVDGEATFSILDVEDASNMAQGLGGYQAFSLFTIGETVSGATGALNPTTAGDYTPPGILDGIGAYELDASTVRIFVNHELLNFRGFPYQVSDGQGGTFSLTGARVSYFDIDKVSRSVTDSGVAINRIYDNNGNLATDNSFLANNFTGFSRFCSSTLIEPHQFGGGRGLEDRIYFTGEEDGGSFNGVGGTEWALDVSNGDFWALPDLGRGAWENVTEIDTGTTTHVAFVLADDTSPIDFDNDGTDEASPLYLYVGEKDPGGDFPARNGLRGGTLYVWVADSGDTLPSQFNGAGTVESGQWVAIENLPNGTPSEDGNTGFDEYGYPTQSTLWLRAEAVGSFGFSRPEDLATNPFNGSQFALASTGVDTYDGGSDAFGTIYSGVIAFDASVVPTSGTLTVLYDGDEDTANRALRSPDNLDWADDGLLYIQEDKAEDDTLDGEPLFGPGAINPNEAGIVRLDPASGELLRVANIDRSVVIDPTIANPLDAVDLDAGEVGAWESSGILDVSALFGEMPGTLFLFDVQAHGIEDQGGINAASRIIDSDLREGGQLLMLERTFEPMLEALAGNAAEAIFTVGQTLPSTNALSVGTDNTYTPVGILDGMGAYELNETTVRVFSNHELLHFRGNSYQVSDGQGGTFSLPGARVSYFDIDKASRKIVDAGLAIKTIYDNNGDIATDNSFLANNNNGLSRFCSSTLIEPHQFGNGRGLEDRIYFTGEEDGGSFNGVGGTEWALDVSNGDFWALPDLGRGAWENVTEIDTGTTTHVAFILADDTSPIDFDNDGTDEASPLYLYVGEKNPGGDFPARNGLRGGTLHVWVADSGNTLPSQFNGAGAVETGQWVAIENLPNGTPTENGSSGFDEYGYPTQSTLWLRAEAVGAFGFSRPEDVATNPANGSEFVLASTGVDTYDNGSDAFGTVYLGEVTFDASVAPTSGTMTVLYDGDNDPARSLRSPDNLEWADDGLIYVQEDKAEEDTLDGEPLFGPGAVNPNEGGIVRIDPVAGWLERVANIDRSVVLDPSITDPLAAVDGDAGRAGEWESSGIIDVSSLFGEMPGKLFLTNVQAHGIADQADVNASSRINDSDLVEGGQMLFFEIGAEQPTINFADMFDINPNTGVITVKDPAELARMDVPFVRITVEADDGLNPAVVDTVRVEINNDPIPVPSEVRFASFNASLFRGSAGALISDLADESDTQAQAIAQIIQQINPDVIVVNEFDHDAAGVALERFLNNYLEVPQNGEQPIYFGYTFNAPSNTGIPSGFDFNNNGSVGGGNDAFGFGDFPGQFAFVVLSKFPIVESQIRTFQRFLWRDMPGAFLPADPNDADGNGDVDNWFTEAELDVFRLSSKNHVDVPILVGNTVIHALASHPTPPVFDGPEDLNGLRNHDETRLFIDYIDGADYIYDDFGNTGGLDIGTPFVVLGDLNADPFDGDSTDDPAGDLLGSPWTNVSLTPISEGGAEANNAPDHVGDNAADTSTFGLRVDYALPSTNLTMLDTAVFWPASGQPGADLVEASDHRLVWVDLLVELEPGTFALSGDAVLNAKTSGGDVAPGNLALVIVGADGQPFDASALENVSDTGELAVGETIGGFEIVGYREVGPNGSVNLDNFGFDLKPGDAGSTVSPGDQFGIVVFDNLLFESDGSTAIASGSLEPLAVLTNPQFLVEDGRQTFGTDLFPIAMPQFELQIIHASDLEGGIDAIERAPNFATIVESLENTTNANGTIILSAGDNFIPGPFFNAAGDSSLRGPLQTFYQDLFAEPGLTNIREGNGRIDIAIMNRIGFDASAIGNHEFDLGSDAFESIIEEDVRGTSLGDIRHLGAQFPYLSANLDFTGDADLGNLFSADLRQNSEFALSPAQAVAGANPFKIAKSTVVDANGEPIAVIGATTQRLSVISSPSGTVVEGGVSDNDIPLLAQQLQPIIDQALLGLDGAPGGGDDINKVVLVTHLQQIALEKQLAALLTNVDVIIAGGSDTLLANPDDTLRQGDVAADAYPVIVLDGDSNPTAIVSTDGEYSYVGQLTIGFDANGVILPGSLDLAINGPIPTTEQAVLDVSGQPTLEQAIASSVSGAAIQELTDAVIGIVEAKDSNVFGFTAFFLDGARESVRTEETNLGNLTADANLAKAREMDPDVVLSFKNGGGIRSVIGQIDGSTGALLPPQENGLKPTGGVSELDIENALRFNNELSLITLSGQDLLEIFTHGFGASVAGSTQGRFPQIGGAQVAFDPPVDVDGDGVIDTPVKIRSFALVNEKGRVSETIYKDGVFADGDGSTEYRIVSLNFLLGGGDGYPFPALGIDRFDTGIGEQQALQEFLATKFPAPSLAFSEFERQPEQDARIQNLSFRFDTIGSDIPVFPAGALRLTPVATFASGVFDESATEIVTFDPTTQRLFAVSSAPGDAVVRVIDAADPLGAGMSQVGEIEAPLPDFEPNSVDFFSGLLGNAVAVAWSDESGTAGRGRVTLHDPATLAMIGSPIEVGFLPDMLTFTPDGSRIVVANEGEVVGGTNPPGSVSIIEFNGSYGSPVHHEATFDRWILREPILRARGILFTQIDTGLAANVAEDFEPEYVAISPNGQTAWVACQENNAVAIVDLVRHTIRNIQALGTVDFSNIPLDASDRDGGADNEPINVTTEPVFGLRQPDAIAMIEVDGKDFLLTANEGDARDFEEIRFKDIGDLSETTFTIDPAASALAALQDDDELGRLEINQIASDLDRDGDIDVIVTFGGRSMTIFEAPEIGRFRAVSGTSMSGNNDMDEYTASLFSTVFHVSNDDNDLPDELENRSDAKGVEPEALTIGEIDGRKYAFIGLERQSGIMVYDVTNPMMPVFHAYELNRNFLADADTPEAGDLGPEGIEFIAAGDSPTGKPMIAVSNEVSGTVTLWEINFGL